MQAHKNLAKLPGNGFTPTLRKWLEIFLANRSINVVVDGQLSESFSTNAGVPQSSIISRAQRITRLPLRYQDYVLNSNSK